MTELKELDDILEIIEDEFDPNKREKAKYKIDWANFDWSKLKNLKSSEYYDWYDRYNNSSPEIPFTNYNVFKQEYEGNWEDNSGHTSFMCQCGTMFEIYGRVEHRTFETYHQINDPLEPIDKIEQFCCLRCGRIIRVMNIKVKRVIAIFNEE